MGFAFLIVDDSAAFGDVARQLLEAEGFDVLGVAPDGASGVALTEAQRPDVVVVDVGLPDLDGFEVASRLRILDRPPRVVLVSSRDWADVPRRIAECGACGFLPKDCLDGKALRDLTVLGP